MKRLIKYIGQINRTGINELYQNSRVGMLVFRKCKNHVEAQPNKMFEYMVAGLPFVASDFEYWRDSLGEFKCCLFADPEDNDEIAKAMSYFLDNSDIAQEYGVRGRNCVEQKINWKNEKLN